MSHNPQHPKYLQNEGQGSKSLLSEEPHKPYSGCPVSGNHHVELIMPPLPKDHVNLIHLPRRSDVALCWTCPVFSVGIQMYTIQEGTTFEPLSRAQPHILPCALHDREELLDASQLRSSRSMAHGRR